VGVTKLEEGVPQPEPTVEPSVFPDVAIDLLGEGPEPGFSESERSKSCECAQGSEDLAGEEAARSKLGCAVF